MNTDEVRQVIDEANRNFGAAIARKDYAGMAAFYAEMPRFCHPMHRLFRGGRR